MRHAGPDGRERLATAPFVIDAGGHRSPFHKACGRRLLADRFRNLALHGYYEGGTRLPAPHSGSILNVSFDRGWFWYIPLTDSLTSVGAVIATRDARLLGADPAAALDRFVAGCPMIADHLAGARRVTGGIYGEPRVRRDWSYANTRFSAPGLLLVGDAACFVDPLFSSGVHLATYSAVLAANAVDECLRAPAREAAVLAAFEARYRKEYLAFYRYLAAFYDTHRDKEDYFRAASEVLGGDEPDRQAFVRLVSGFGSLAPAPDRGDLAQACPPRAFGRLSPAS